MFCYSEMERQTKNFYKSIGIDIPEELTELAIRSLTMPQYAKEYNDKHDNHIGDHTSLATVGDAVCSAFVMLDKYTDDKTSEDLTKDKNILTNVKLNIIGKKLKDFLFDENNDLAPTNKKAYATAFEAVIGFIALTDKKAGTNNVERILKEWVGCNNE